MSDLSLVLLVNFLGEIKTTLKAQQGASDEDQRAVNVWSGSFAWVAMLRMLPGINIKPYINVKLTECKNTSQITLYPLNIDEKNSP